MSELSTAAVISDYASLFNKGTQKHMVSSPLGLWLLLATSVVPEDSTSADTKRDIERTLGIDTVDAFSRAKNLLENIPEPIAAAIAVWTDGTMGDKYHVWAESLRSCITEKSYIPDSEELDTWANENTKGIIKKFPLKPDEDTCFILASALATKISWYSPFKTVNLRDDYLMSSWGKDSVLKSVGGHQVFVIDTPYGLFGVHGAFSSDGLAVYSVISQDPQTPVEKVLEVANHLGDYKKLALDELELIEGVISVSEHLGVQNTSSALLPAWEATTKLDLLKDYPECGARAMVSAFAQKGVGDTVSVAQVAKAKYSKTGFEAAAVTAVFFGRSSAMATHAVRALSVSFAHPYAVVAQLRGNSFGAWDNLPVFNAWVAEAVEA